MPEDSSPSYGVIDHYLGLEGKEYFDWQGADGLVQANYNRHLWQRHISPTNDVLDFGCGGGFLLEVLSARKKVGVEINPHARERACSAGLEVYETIEQVPGLFDRVITSHVLEHVPHPRQAVIELKRKLRDEHSLMLILLPLDDWRSRANRHFNLADRNLHLHTWTPLLLANLLRTCGLKVETVRVINHAWPPGKQFLWRLSPGLFHTAAFAWSVLHRQRQLFAIAHL